MIPFMQRLKNWNLKLSYSFSVKHPTFVLLRRTQELGHCGAFRERILNRLIGIIGTIVNTLAQLGVDQKYFAPSWLHEQKRLSCEVTYQPMLSS